MNTSLHLTAESAHVEKNLVGQGVDTSIQDHNEVNIIESMCDKCRHRNTDKTDR